MQKFWQESYKSIPSQLNVFHQVRGVVSAFNVNIDAVIKISGKQIVEILSDEALSLKQIYQSEEPIIRSKSDLLRGFLDCFEKGKAAEWLVKEKDLLKWLESIFPKRHFQMGGQAGIIANALSICEVPQIFVHCASLPRAQADLFLNKKNLLTWNESGQLKTVHEARRDQDTPLVHWILEFDKDDSLTIEGRTYTCPKSNRFIATYDPSNFELMIDQHFKKGIADQKIDYVILSGFQLLEESLSNGETGLSRIEEAKEILHDWKKRNSECIFHLEFASTQNVTIRSHLLNQLAPTVDSLGFNERELIDLLLVMDKNSLAEKCEKSLESHVLFEGSLEVFRKTGVSRVQLHMFGLYLTIQKKNYKISPEANRRGMQIAAVLAGSKAKTGSIEKKKNLLTSLDESIKQKSFDELNLLAQFLSKEYGAENFEQSGIYLGNDFDVIAIPSIIIDKPVTLVGMGDTISSLSLIGAH